jgi:hypothetical protein
MGSIRGRGKRFFSKMFIPLGAYPVPYTVGTAGFFPRVKATGAGNSLPLPSVDVENTWIHNATPPSDFMSWFLIKQRENFTIIAAKHLWCRLQTHQLILLRKVSMFCRGSYETRK